MSIKRTITLLVLVIIGFVVWKQFLAKPALAPVVPQPAAVTTSISGAVLKDTGDFYYQKDGEYLTIEAIYPSKTDLVGDANDKARATIETLLKDRMSAFEKEATDDLLSPEEMARLKDMGRKYAMGISYKTYASPGFVSYVFDIYQDTGGAHPNGFYATLTFDTAGNTVQLADLFAPGARYLDKLSAESYKLVLAEAKKRFGEDPNDDQKDWIRMGTAPTPEALQFFYLDGGDVVLIFPPYQVAAYAFGTFEARIPIASLSAIWKK